MKSTKVFLLFVSVFFIASNVFSQREDIVEQMRKVTHNPIVNFQDETLSQDAILNDMLNRNSKRNVLRTTDVVDSVIAIEEDSVIVKYKYTYDSNGNMTSELDAKWDWSVKNWVNSVRATYTPDFNGNITLYLLENWDGTNWVNSYRVTPTYDISGNMTLSLFENWDGANWVNSSRATLTYDTSGNLTLILLEEWVFTNWVTHKREVYTYDTSGNMTLFWVEGYVGTNWVVYWRRTCVYDTNGNMILELNEGWDGTNWSNAGKTSFTYDSNGNMILKLDEESEMWTYTYDTNGNMTLILSEDWDGTNWVNSMRETFTYDSNGNMTLYLAEVWVGTNWLLVYDNNWGDIHLIDSFGFDHLIKGNKIQIFYKTITEINENELEISDFSLSQNYPNPFNPSTTINYSIPQSNLVELKVFDVLGREIAVLVNEEKQIGNYQVKFDATGLSSGVYYYTLKSGDFVKTKKLILLR